MASFQAKIGWKRQKKRKNENYPSVSFLPDPKQKIPKKQHKNSKNLKIPVGLHFKPKQVGKDREREKIKFSFRFVPRNGEFRKSSETIQEIKKYDHGFISSKNRW